MTDIAPRTRSDRRAHRRGAVRDWAIVLLALAVAAVATLAGMRLSSDRNEAVETSSTLGQQVLTVCRSGGAAKFELDQIGACGTAEEAAAQVEPASAPKPLAPSDDQVRVAVAQFLTEHPPSAGHTPSAAEVDAAVTRVCAAIVCRGADGTNGTNGTNGENGEDGPGPTAEVVAASVAAYCGQEADPCRSQQGPSQQQVNDYCAASPDACRSEPPARLTWTDSQGGQQSCTRDETSPDNAPTYACTAPPIEILPEVP